MTPKPENPFKNAKCVKIGQSHFFGSNQVGYSYLPAGWTLKSQHLQKLIIAGTYSCKAERKLSLGESGFLVFISEQSSPGN